MCSGMSADLQNCPLLQNPILEPGQPRAQAGEARGGQLRGKDFGGPKHFRDKFKLVRRIGDALLMDVCKRSERVGLGTFHANDVGYADTANE